MDSQILSFFIVLGVIWFLLYWILGGVFFAVMAIMRLGRIHTVRFSCLFTLLTLCVGAGASYFGLSRAKDVVATCVESATSKAEIVAAIFGCGFVNILTWFLLGACILTIGGFIIMSISKSKSKPWIVLDEPDEETNTEGETQPGIVEETHVSKFFES